MSTGTTLRAYIPLGLIGHEEEVRGGTLKILVLDEYDDRVDVVWRYIPAAEPFYTAFGKELEAAVVPPGPWDDSPLNRELQLGGRVVVESMALTDDLGTKYGLIGSSYGGGHVKLDISGTCMFAPSFPMLAKVARVSVLGGLFVIPFYPETADHQGDNSPDNTAMQGGAVA